MEQVRVERLDHLGLIASVIKDLGLIGMIDKRLVPDAQEVITPGEAVAAMILNGLGFANRPLSPADNVSRPLPYRLRRLNQPVRRPPHGFSIPRSTLLSSI